MKKQKVIYKIVIGLLVFLFGFGGISNILQLPEAMASLELLGSPNYFSLILGIAQLLGITILLIPSMARLREIVFFGFFINLVSALVSHLVVEGFAPVLVIILFALCILVTAYILSLRLQHSNNQN